jgi:hypothetical protein
LAIPLAHISPLRRRQETKKAGVAENPKVFHHVGLLI